MKHTPVVVFDHMSLTVRRFAQARKLYESALGAIGMKTNLEFDSAFGMGSKDEKIFWVERDKNASGGAHIALRVEHREEVDAFHAAALEAGATDNGPPGLRPSYGPNYYAAFIKDGEGNNIEVVCYRKPPRRAKRAAMRKKSASKRRRA